jgi:hypothetical protein
MSAGDVRPACSVGVEVRGHLVASNAGEVRLQRRPHVGAMAISDKVPVRSRFKSVT